MEGYFPAIHATEAVPQTVLAGELAAAANLETTMDAAAAALAVQPAVLAAQPSMAAVPDVAAVPVAQQPKLEPRLELEQQIPVENVADAAAEVYFESAPLVATAHSAAENVSMGESSLGPRPLPVVPAIGNGNGACRPRRPPSRAHTSGLPRLLAHHSSIARAFGFRDGDRGIVGDGYAAGRTLAHRVVERGVIVGERFA